MKRIRESDDNESEKSEKSTMTPSTSSDKKNTFKEFQNLYYNKLSSDVTLVVGGEAHPAHRFVLSISSDVFEIMLMKTRWNDSKKTVIELQEDPQCLEAFPIFLKYFYFGFIKLEQTNLLQVLMLADKYCVKELIIFCISYMFRQICEAAEQGHLIIWFQYILSLNQPINTNDLYYYKLWQDPECSYIQPPWTELFKACRNFIKWNLDLCNKCFCSFECDILVGLLKQSDLVLLDEMQLFGYVVNWLSNQETVKLPENNDSETIKNLMSSLTKRVMSYIRYPMIAPRLISYLFMFPIVKHYKDFFVDVIATAIEYNVIKIEKQSNTKILLECTPRLYTNDRWGNVFKMCSKSIEDFEPFQSKFKTDDNLFEREEVAESYWEIEFYLKGINYDGTLLATSEGFMMLPDSLTGTKSAIIKLKLDQEIAGQTSRHVRVAIIVYAVQNLIVHVATLVQRVVLFDSNVILMTVKDLLAHDTVGLESNENSKYKNKTNVSYFMYDQTSLKFNIIITPIIPGLTDAHVDTCLQNVHL